MISKLNAEGYTLVPLKLYIKEGNAKILIGVAKGKKTYDKKEVIKQRDIDRYNKKVVALEVEQKVVGKSGKGLQIKKKAC